MGARKVKVGARSIVSAVAAGGLALVLAACGSSTTSSAAGSGSSGAGAASGSPVTLGLLWQVKGEGPYGQNTYQDGALLAISQINKAGGVNGQKVTWFRKPVAPTNTQEALTTFLAAVEKKPTAMVGLVAPTQIQALASHVTAAGIPLLATTTADTFDAYGAKSGSKSLWFIGAYTPALADFGTHYMLKTLKLTKIGTMGTNTAYGTSGMNAAAATMAKTGLKPFATAPYSSSATDLTQEVLAMKGADGVLDWGYPNTIGVQLNQFLQNGMHIPTMASDAVDTTVSSGAAKGTALAMLYASQPCDLTAPSYSPGLATFVRQFKAAYGFVPSQNAAWAYDGVKVAVAAVNKAGSTTPGSVNKALGTVSVPGACSTVYKADAAHFMAHSEEISKYSTSGAATVVKTGTIPPVPAGG